ncbi:hypothetical protein [Pseudophaeobacter sp.]|uniref:hypothetical protein n=1 Tax=Pseudophaeobacter sp. TaxID=1971739 RepID=UPI0040586854
MSDFIDDDGQPIFTDNFIHEIIAFEENDFDIIKTNGNIWFNGSDVLNAMGFLQHKSGGQSRRLNRISHPDIIKISDTNFRFPDGRRNRGSLISPRAVLQFAEGGTQGFNQIKALPFVDWMTAAVLSDGLDAEAWSPARAAPVVLAPVFHKTEIAENKDEQGRELDPLRPIGIYPTTTDGAPIGPDEVEFCMCYDERAGVGNCWCRGKGRIREAVPLPFVLYAGDDVIDDGDQITPPLNYSVNVVGSHDVQVSKPNAANF